MLNVTCNLPEPGPAADAARARASFFSGDWGALRPVMRPEAAPAFDIVLMAETVYAPATYPRLCSLLQHLQAGAADATIYLASKTYYFGVGALALCGRGLDSAHGTPTVDPLHIIFPDNCSLAPREGMRNGK